MKKIMQATHRKRRPLQLEALEQRQMLHGGVYPEVTLQTNFGDITIELYADDAPGTVQNFLNYINDGDYTNAIFHRSVSNFVLQGGGFTSDPAELCVSPCGLDDVDPSQFAEIATDPPIENEFARSNVRSTVAMAKIGSDPDSATNQFFVNLNDNSSNLDNQNGGFTVFGGVTDMGVVDQIAALQTVDLSSLFPSSRLSAISQAPVDIDDATDEIRLIRIESITGKGLLHGTVFLDVDGDGVRDAGEGGLPGRVVYLDQNDNGTRETNEVMTFTNDLGQYHFLVAPGNYTVRREVVDDFDGSASAAKQMASVGLGEDANNLDFGSRHTGLSWHNEIQTTDVDGMNGTTPIDALLVINELDERDFSDTLTGILRPQSNPLNPPRFLDVVVNNQVEPFDALSVINQLPSSAPAAALSSFANDPHPPLAGVLPPALGHDELVPNTARGLPRGSEVQPLSADVTGGSADARPAGPQGLASPTERTTTRWLRSSRPLAQNQVPFVKTVDRALLELLAGF